MDFSAFLSAVKNLETDRMLQYLAERNIGELIHNPWFLGTMAALAVVALLCKWRVLLATILGVTGLAWLVSYTVQQGTELESVGNTNLLVFAGGGALIVFVMIYLLFIHHD